MTLASLTSILWRQRWRVIPAMIVALLLCLAVVLTSPPTYRATASVVLLNPPTPPQAQVGGPTIPDEWQNPYVRIGNLSVIVDLMVKVMGSDPVANDLVAAGFDGTAEMAGNRDYYTGPIVDMASEASSEKQAIANVELLTAAFSERLEQLQTDTIERYRIRAEAVTAPTEATTVFSHTLRQLIVAIALGGILVLGIAIVSDRLRSRSATDDSDAKISELDEKTASADDDATSGKMYAKRGRRSLRRRVKTAQLPHASDDDLTAEGTGPIGPSMEDVELVAHDTLLAEHGQSQPPSPR